MRDNSIKCPNCGYEYEAGEIFTPNAFLGQPKNIKRDENGEILWSDGIEQCLREEYVCDNCNRRFTIEAKINFKISDITNMNDFLSPKYKNSRTTLDETL